MRARHFSAGEEMGLVSEHPRRVVKREFELRRDGGRSGVDLKAPLLDGEFRRALPVAIVGMDRRLPEKGWWPQWLAVADVAESYAVVPLWLFAELLREDK